MALQRFTRRVAEAAQGTGEVKGIITSPHWVNPTIPVFEISN